MSNRKNKSTKIKPCQHHGRPALLACLISLTLITLTLCGTEFRGLGNSKEFTDKANKEVVLHIEAPGHRTAHNNSDLIGLSFSLRPRKMKWKRFIEPFKPPKPSFVAIYKWGVMLKHFKKTWIQTKVSKTHKEYMAQLLMAKNSVEITAFHMDGADPLLTLAFSNRTVIVLDVKKSKPGAPKFIQIFDFEKSYPGFKGQINCIGRIPYTEHLVLTPNAYKLVKIDRLLGDHLTEVRSPVDEAKFIVFPAATTIPQYESYNPHARGIRFYRPLHKLVVTPRTFAVTSAETEYVSLTDWSNLAQLNTFTVRKNEEAYDNPSEYVVTSICFYGGVPVAHTYALMTKHTNKEIVLFDGIFNLYKGVVKLKTDYQNTELTWLNGTTYIMACQYNNGDSHCHPTLVDFSPMRAKDYTFNFTSQHFTVPVNSGFQMVPYRVIKTWYREGARHFRKSYHTDHLNMHYNLDHIFLTMYVDQGKLIIKPPFFPWNFCHENTLDNLQKDHKMLFGLYRFCRTPSKFMGRIIKDRFCGDNPRCIWDNWRSLREKRLKKVGFRGNVFRRQCYLGNLNVIEYTHEEDYFRCTTLRFRNFLIKLSHKYTPNPIDPHDHMSCGNSYKFFMSEQFNRDMQYKKCLLSDYTGLIHDSMINSPRYFFAQYRDKSIAMNIGKVIFKTRDLFEKKYFIPNDKRFFVINYKGRKYNVHHKPCYYIEPNKNNEREYVVRLKSPYVWRKISEDESGKAKPQIGLYDSEGVFNQMYCWKECPIGQFYDFDSVDCRFCPPGCLSCNSSGVCIQDSCGPGEHPIREPASVTHQSEFKRLKNEGEVCLKSQKCQRCFFFDKSRTHHPCIECASKCVACEPNPHYKASDPKNQRKNLCLKCDDRSFLDSATKQCIPGCSTEGKFMKTIPAYKGEKEVRVCIECHVEGCAACETFNPKKCSVCKTGMELDKTRTKCKEVNIVTLPKDHWKQLVDYFFASKWSGFITLVCLIFLSAIIVWIWKKWSPFTPDQNPFLAQDVIEPGYTSSEQLNHMAYKIDHHPPKDDSKVGQLKESVTIKHQRTNQICKVTYEINTLLQDEGKDNFILIKKPELLEEKFYLVAFNSLSNFLVFSLDFEEGFPGIETEVVSHQVKVEGERELFDQNSHKFIRFKNSMVDRERIRIYLEVQNNDTQSEVCIEVLMSFGEDGTVVLERGRGQEPPAADGADADEMNSSRILLKREMDDDERA